MELNRLLLDRFLQAILQAHLDGEATFEETQAELTQALKMAARGDQGLDAFMKACIDA